MDLNSLEQQAHAFYLNLMSQTKSVGIDLTFYSPDHLCYRVKTMDQYHLAKEFLSQTNELLTEAEIRGRPIATFRLRTPIQFGEHDISLIELPAPQPQKPYRLGFEHVEYVINEPFEILRERYPSLQGRFEIRNNPYNPEMVLPLQDISLKFHYSSLDQVIEVEESPRWKKQIVIFDLDGTLIDSLPQIELVNRRLLQSLGVSSQQLMQAEFPTNFPDLLKKFNLSHLDHESFAQQWGFEMFKAPCRLVEGVSDLLAEINQLGIPMVVWTARDQTSALETLRKLEIDRYFKRVLGFKTKYSKPELAGIRFLTEGRPAELISFVGDSATDWTAARNFGCQFFWAKDVLSSSEGRRQFVEKLTVDHAFVTR
ncbi:MAG TPA: VOC family protein [Bdellovibrio sp.]|uniref:VOC family protein n=1 Tax=Bdellovibrio sp. TaxID=28201 RepID=UPI002F0D1C62